MRFGAETVHADFVIERERARTDERGELTGRAAAGKIHLKEAILRVQEAERPRDIFASGAADRRDAEMITRDPYRRAEARQRARTVELRQARIEFAPRPEAAGNTRDQNDDDPYEDGLEKATHPGRHVITTARRG
jgi:hypothetical protein